MDKYRVIAIRQSGQEISEIVRTTGIIKAIEIAKGMFWYNCGSDYEIVYAAKINKPITKEV